MPYGLQSEYLKHNADCGCEDSTSCGCTSDDCGCCPIGTVAVYDDCGKHISCLTPVDASQYYTDTVDVPEGFIKLTDPTTGALIGLVTIADYAAYLAASGTGLTFVTTGPITITPTAGTPGSFDVVVQSSVNPYNTKEAEPSDSFVVATTVGAGATEVNTLRFDRNAFYGDIVVTFDALPTGFSGGTVNVPAAKSRVDTVTGFPTLSWAGVTSGSYTANLVVTPAGLTPVNMAVSITLS